MAINEILFGGGETFTLTRAAGGAGALRALGFEGIQFMGTTGGGAGETFTGSQFNRGFN
jgi:hypothetical protein